MISNNYRESFNNNFLNAQEASESTMLQMHSGLWGKHHRPKKQFSTVTKVHFVAVGDGYHTLMKRVFSAIASSCQ
jgi:hypothetical protein